MFAYQLSVKAENRPGNLAKITDILEEGKINIRAVTITSFNDHGIINLLVDNPRLATRILEKKNVSVVLKKVIAVLIEDKPGGLNRLVRLLANENINLEDAYGFVLESRKHAVLVLDVDQPEKTQKILSSSGYKTLNADALSAIEPFHYIKY